MNYGTTNVTQIVVWVAALFVAGCRYEKIEEGDFVCHEMCYAALDGSGVYEKSSERLERVDKGEEWFECDYGESFTNSVGEKITLMEYCRFLYAEGAMSADSWLERHATRCDIACEASFNSRIVEKCIGSINDSQSLEEELARYSLWHIADDLYLVKTEESGGQMGMHMYWFVMADVNADIIKELLVFDYLPDGEMEIESMKQARTNPAAMNNIAAMVFNHVAWHHSIADEYVEKLLLLAAQSGEPAACRNLAVLYSSYPYDKEKCRQEIDYWLSRANECAMAVDAGRKTTFKPLSIYEWPEMW